MLAMLRMPSGADRRSLNPHSADIINGTLARRRG
jgi:hypothetical protein